LPFFLVALVSFDPVYGNRDCRIGILESSIITSEHDGRLIARLWRGTINVSAGFVYLLKVAAMALLEIARQLTAPHIPFSLSL
jgi:hypothetical protein